MTSLSAVNSALSPPLQQASPATTCATKTSLSASAARVKFASAWGIAIEQAAKTTAIGCGIKAVGSAFHVLDAYSKLDPSPLKTVMVREALRFSFLMLSTFVVGMLLELHNHSKKMGIWGQLLVVTAGATVAEISARFLAYGKRFPKQVGQSMHLVPGTPQYQLPQSAQPKPLKTPPPLPPSGQLPVTLNPPPQYPVSNMGPVISTQASGGLALPANPSLVLK